MVILGDDFGEIKVSKRLPEETRQAVLAYLEGNSNARTASRKCGVSYSSVWRIANQAGCALTAGQAAKGRPRISPEKHAAILADATANPNATVKELARRHGASPSTAWKIVYRPAIGPAANNLVKVKPATQNAL